MQELPTELELSRQKHQRTSSRGNKKYNIWCSEAIKLLQPVPYVYDLHRRVFNNEFLNPLTAVGVSTSFVCL